MIFFYVSNELCLFITKSKCIFTYVYRYILDDTRELSILKKSMLEKIMSQLMNRFYTKGKGGIGEVDRNPLTKDSKGGIA